VRLQKLTQLSEIEKAIGNSQDVLKSVESLVAENRNLLKEIEISRKRLLTYLKLEVKGKLQKSDTLTWAALQLQVNDAQSLKNLSFQLKNEYDNLVLVLAADLGEKVAVSALFSENITTENFNAKQIIKMMSSHINGGGGGQDFFATAGGKNPEGIPKALQEAQKQILSI